MSMTIGNSTILQILHAMSDLNTQQATTMARLSTNQRINKASDDPTGLVALRSLNGQLTSVNAAIDSNTKATNLLNVADTTLQQVSTLVSQIQSAVAAGSSSTASASDKAGYQAQIDESVDAIDRLVNGATFNGKSVFNGDNRINVATNSTASIKNLQVYRRNPNAAAAQTLTVNVTAAATRGSAVTTFGTATALSAQTTVQVTGKLGTATIVLSNGMTGTNIMAAIVAQKGITGVSAAAQGANMAYMSTTTGSDAFASVQVLDGSKILMNTGAASKTSGADAQVRVNNEQATAQGTQVFYNGAGLSLSFNLAKNAVNAGLTVTVNGGGATFQLGDSSTSKVNIGLSGANAAELGRSDIGYLSDLKSGGSQAFTVTGNNATSIAAFAGQQVATLDARIGNFTKYQIGSYANVLETSKEGLTSMIGNINNVDYAGESAALQREQTLMSAATSMLGLANSSQANVLALLR